MPVAVLGGGGARSAGGMLSLSRRTWVGIGLAARLVMLGVLALSVKRRYAIHTQYTYQNNYQELQSYTYVVVVAGVGMLASLLQVPVGFYLLCKSTRTTASVLVLDVTMYTDMVVTAVLASGVGAGFGSTDDALQYVKEGTDWSGTDDGEDRKRDLIAYYNEFIVVVVLLLVGMLLSLLATVASTRLRTRASDDLDD